MKRNFWQKKFFGKIRIWALFIIILLILGGLYLYYTNIKPKQPKEQENAQNLCKAPDRALVVRVVDGDTIVIEGGYRVRLLEINADEVGQPCYQAAKDKLEELLVSKEVYLEKDNTDIDQYGRCLRYVFLNGVNINYQMVKDGFAVSDIFESDTKYKDDILRAERIAQNSNTGCKWQKK